MTPDNKEDVRLEEYNNAIDKLNLAYVQMKALIESLMSENRILKIELAKQDEMEDRKFTLEWLKDDTG